MGKIKVNDIGASGKASLRARLITAGILIAIVAPAIFLGGWFWFAVVAIALGVSIYEFLGATKKKYRWYIYVVCYIATLAFAFWGILKANGAAFAADSSHFTFSLTDHFSGIYVSILGAVVALGVFFLCAILHDDFDLGDVFDLFGMCFLIGVGFQAMMFLRYFPQYLAHNNIGFAQSIETDAGFLFGKSALLIVLVTTGTCLNDAWAYFVGMFFGKHHINPRVSPKKTYEGFWGGWILASLSIVGLAAILEATGNPIIPGYLDMNHWFWLVLIAVAIPGLANLGDFSFSLIKRYFGTKDFGWLLKGHGGVLDRLDSLLFSYIGVSVLVIFIVNGWNFFA